MNFAEAFSKTIGKDIPKQEEPASKNLDQGITTDEMQKYIDAKFEEESICCKGLYLAGLKDGIRLLKSLNLL